MRAHFSLTSWLPAVLILCGAGCTPLPEPDLWFVAEEDQLTFATSPEQADRVDVWRDRVAGVEAVTGATPDAKPRLIPDAAGGRGAIHFGGKLGFETGPVPSLETDELCAFVVGRLSGSQEGAAWFLSAAYEGGAGSALESQRMWSLHTGQGGQVWAAAETAALGRGPVYSRAARGARCDRMTLIELCWTGDDEVVLVMDGEVLGSTPGADAEPAGHTHLYLGTSGEHQHLRGEIAEVRIYGRALSLRERTAVERDIAIRHQISLSRPRRVGVYMVIGGWGVFGVVALLTRRGRRRRST